MDVQSWPIDRIRVGPDRVRKNVGDLASLKISMTGIGQLLPIAVQPDGLLVFGERRLTAARELGWETVEVSLFTPTSAAEILRAEIEENTERLQLMPAEAMVAWRRHKELIEPGQGARSDLTLSNFDKVPQDRTDRAAAKATGYSSETLRKVDEIATAADNSDEPIEVREEAARQMEVLSRPDPVTGKPPKVDPAHKAVRRARDRARRDPLGGLSPSSLMPGQQATPPAPARPQLTLTQRLIAGINKGQGLADLAAEVQDQDLPDLGSDTIDVLRRRLRTEAAERNHLDRALKSVTDKRKASAP